MNFFDSIEELNNAFRSIQVSRHGEPFKPLDWHYSIETRSDRQELTMIKDDQYLIEVSLCGLTQEDIEIEIVDSKIHVSVNEAGRSKTKFQHHASMYDVPEQFDVSHVTAKMEHGLLQLSVPRRQVTKKTVTWL